jgi:hypothetical protein
MMLSGLAPHVSKLKYLLNDNSTTLLSVAGVGGSIATALLTGRATFKAARLIDETEDLRTEHRTEHGPEDENKPMSKTEKTKLVWHLYLPPVASGVLTVTCIIVAHRISSKQIVALTAAAGISERALNEYKEKVLEKFGAKEDTKIQDDIAQDRVNKFPPSSQIMITGSGDVLCYDMLTGRYFQSTMEELKRAENKVNYELIHYMSCSLTHFYDEIGLPPTSYSDTHGWNMDHHMELKFSTVLSEDNRPCIAIDFNRQPIADYDTNWR